VERPTATPAATPPTGRRAYLLAKHGDGDTCPCYRCGVVLDDSTITVDRVVPGVAGGRYTRDNIRPACGPCNFGSTRTVGRWEDE
jgi:5-methylcytosine-specific restriction endonuclease McrA